MNNDFLKKLEPQHMREMVDCMFEGIYTAQQLVIEEGQPGNYLYVLAGPTPSTRRTPVNLVSFSPL